MVWKDENAAQRVEKRRRKKLGSGVLCFNTRVLVCIFKLLSFAGCVQSGFVPVSLVLLNLCLHYHRVKLWTIFFQFTIRVSVHPFFFK